MLGQTQTVETVVLLSQRRPDTTIDVNLDISELEVSKAETKATYEEIKFYVLEQHGLKGTNLYIAQVKRECGIVERENSRLYDKMFPSRRNQLHGRCQENHRNQVWGALNL